MLFIINKNDNNINILKEVNNHYLSIFKCDNLNSYKIDNLVNKLPIYDDVNDLKLMLSNNYHIIYIKDNIWDSFLDLLSLSNYDINIVYSHTFEYKIDEKVYITKNNNSLFLIDYIYKFFLVNILKNKEKSFQNKSLFIDLCHIIYYHIFKIKDINYIDTI